MGFLVNTPSLSNRPPAESPDPLILTLDDRADWQAALTDAQLDRMSVEASATMSTGFMQYTGYRVVFDDDGSTVMLPVTVARDIDGRVYTLCACAIGQTERPCPHAAIAVEHAGLWPFPIASQTRFAD